jgi:two-component system, NtrC family, sensor histidine kinase HydH
MSVKRIARWGLALSTAALSIALVASSAAAYLGASRSAESITQALAFTMTSSVRRALRGVPIVDGQVLSELLDDLRSDGMRYLAVVDENGEVTATVGTAELASAATFAPLGAGLSVVRRGDRVRVVTPFAEQGRGMGRAAGPGRRGRTRLVLEYESRAASALVSRAAYTLGVGSAAAVLLVVAAAVFWRMSIAADRDRHLKKLGEMSAILGHELRNPLTSLKGHAQLLAEEIDPDAKEKEAVETIVREAVRLENLANEILDFARTGALDKTIADPVAVARAAAEAEPGTIVRAPEPVPRCSLDRARIQQALLALLDNARKATADRSPIELTTRTEGARLVYEVRDHGAGLPAGQEEAVFEPFVTTRARGAGLGLTIARRIVEEHHGTLSAHNHPDGGAVFRISIPMEAA